MTERISFTNMEQTSVETVVTAVDSNLGIIYLAGSPFYPRGGGQQGDRGIIQGPSGRMIVTDTLQNRETGDMFHVGAIEGSFSAGDTVHAEIDQEWRTLNTRIHTAGHLIDIALESLQPHIWECGRGYHYQEGPYVAYTTTGSAEVPEAAVLEEAANAIVAENLPRQVAFDGDYRSIGFGQHAPVGCGGTHVIQTGDVGRIIIRGLRFKKGELLIRYDVHR